MNDRITIRHKPLPDAPKGKCRLCGADVPKGRRSWCGEECAREGWARGSASFARRYVFERDRGVCAEAECRFDTEDFRRRWNEAIELDDHASLWRCQRCRCIWNATDGPCDYCDGELRREPSYDGRRALLVELLTRGYTSLVAKMPPSWADGDYFHLWEMDHIVPVIEGGGSCGLDNLRTLCVPCHRRATAALAKRRAHERRAEKKREARRSNADSV